MTHTSIHPNTTVGPVSLNVSDIDKSEAFYRDVIGLAVLKRREGEVVLTVDGTTPLLSLKQLPDAAPRPPRTTGLYHFAILVPTRRDLARSIKRLVEMQWPLSGAADHLVSEALYLNDPEGNGIEIYRDRPRDSWEFRNGMVKMASNPLDFAGIMREVADDDAPWTGLPAGTTIGHVHLQVHDIEAAKAFYHDILGFDVVATLPSALFISAGGYHHHLGLNTWTSQGAPPPPKNAVGLDHFVIALPNVEELERIADRLRQADVPMERSATGVLVRDPSGNGVSLVASP